MLRTFQSTCALYFNLIKMESFLIYLFTLIDLRERTTVLDDQITTNSLFLNKLYKYSKIISLSWYYIM